MGLIDDAIRKAGDYRSTSETSLGLHTTSLASLHGTVRVYLPEDIRVGDTISGTVEVEPAGATPEERQRNGATLSGVVISIEDEETSASDGDVRWQVPLIETGTAVLVLRDPSGAEVGRTSIPVNPVPDGLGPIGPAPFRATTRLPPIVQFGNPFTVTGPFDGEFVTTALDFGGELTLLAESPRTLIARAPTELVGQHTMTLSRARPSPPGRSIACSFFFSAGKLDLLKGETTMVTAEVIGFAGLDPEAYPIEFEMINHSPETVTMEGLEDNRFYQLIHPPRTSPPAKTFPPRAASSSRAPSTEFAPAPSTSRQQSPHRFSSTSSVPDEQLACSEEKRYRLLCVRFIVLDEPGAKDRADGTRRVSSKA